MNFNKIKISGFKSFVESTELSLQKGLTGIVGPNGCGKSNIVDALKWIMGENSPKEMRGKGMDDVIFNGTSIRPQNDLAEIEIIIDNKSKTAPEIFKDCETIEVKRKIEREKGSTYYINNKIVRAKDVRLLFADASSGPNTTSIVAQGEIHKLINSKPEERRILLEEAAGITGLHARRHEAELKLKSAGTNLSRLEDIIKTHKDQYKILEKQVKEAEKYKIVKDKINNLEITLIKIRCINNLNSISKKTAKLEKINQDINIIDTLLESCKNEKNKFLNKNNEKNDNLNNLKIEKQNHLTEKQKNIDEINRISIQKESLNNRLTQLTEDISREKKFLEDANFSLSKLQKNIFNETKELDIKISSNEKNTNKENFINLKKDIENELKKIDFIISKSNELNSKINELSNQNKNLISPIKNAFNIISEKIKNIFSSFTEIKNNFSKLTNLDKIFDFEEEHAKWSKRINESKKHLNDLVEREKIINNELNNLKSKPDEINKRISLIDEKVSLLDKKINDLNKEIVIDPTQTKEIDEKIKLNSEKKIRNHEEKTRLETDLEYLNNDLNTAYQESENNFSLKLNKEILEKEKINIKELPARSILQNDLNAEKRRFDNIGPINFTAENEAKETNKKIEKMINDKLDVEKAILKLRESITNINKEGREKINNCFDGINESFKKLFSEFFDGGKSYLKMVGSPDPLLSGLEVFVSPPGKKMNTLSLLSGGEKTMTATALILAVFLQNPSPICVLDEVDAPLDDINIEKYCKLIKKIRQDTETKFIIITHNPITMAHMDRLYGVTMAETGISKLISVKLQEAQKLREVS
tara:strand:- start:1532 stop:3985 length:2454 start_codon:yes stop_codon:yes gene_type:complete